MSRLLVPTLESASTNVFNHVNDTEIGFTSSA
jgi:hypothetical protein